jgi:hypothetical protein
MGIVGRLTGSARHVRSGGCPKSGQSIATQRRGIMRYLSGLLMCGVLAGLFFTDAASAAPGCKSVSKANSAGEVQKIEICIQSKTFQHDIYVLSLNDEEVFEKIDDQVQQFKAAFDGKTIVGGCKPNHKMGELAGKPYAFEVSRTCKVAVNGQEIGVMKFSFE